MVRGPPASVALCSPASIRGAITLGRPVSYSQVSDMSTASFRPPCCDATRTGSTEASIAVKRFWASCSSMVLALAMPDMWGMGDVRAGEFGADEGCAQENHASF